MHSNNGMGTLQINCNAQYPTHISPLRRCYISNGIKGFVAQFRALGIRRMLYASWYRHTRAQRMPVVNGKAFDIILSILDAKHTKFDLGYSLRWNFLFFINHQTCCSVGFWGENASTLFFTSVRTSNKLFIFWENFRISINWSLSGSLVNHRLSLNFHTNFFSTLIRTHWDIPTDF